jgi:hypothetical protein
MIAGTPGRRDARTPGRRTAGGGRLSPAARSDPEPGVRGRGERLPEEAAGARSHEMARYLISFNNGAMDIPEDDLPDVADAAHAVVQKAKDAGVFVFSGGLPLDPEYDVVSTDGMVTDGPYPESKEFIGGMLVVDVPTREAALEWAAKIAVACRCAQDVREFLPDPTVE